MSGIVLQPGDVVLTRGEGFIGRSIRYFQRDKGEAPSKVNHVGIVVESPDILVEALWTVKRHSIQRYTKPGNEIAVYRLKNQTPEQIRAVVKCAEEYVGRKYGVLKILLHAGDRGLTKLVGPITRIFGRKPPQDLYILRRVGRIKRYPICSYAVAKARAAGGYLFIIWEVWKSLDGATLYRRTGIVQPERCQPDDIWDDVTRNPDWECVFALGKLEPGMIASSLTAEDAKKEKAFA